MKMGRHFLKLYSSYKDVIVEVDLSNYAAKSDAKKETGVDTLSFAKNLIQLAWYQT